MRTKYPRPDTPFDHPRSRNTQNAQDTKNALYDLLENIESGGAFATYGVFFEAPLPDLVLKGYGPIPLAQRDADALCKERTEDNKGKDCIRPGVLN